MALPETSPDGGPQQAPRDDALPLGRVLIVDDQTRNRDLLDEAIRQHGFDRIDKAGSCSEALKCVRANAPDLAILDANLPDGDGIAFMHQLSGTMAGALPPVLMTSSDHDTALRQRALEAGVLDFVTKPFNSAEVAIRARNLAIIGRQLGHLQERVQFAEATMERRGAKLDSVMKLLHQADQRLGEAHDRLDEANRSRWEFLASMSHELRTPLNAVIGFSEVMQAERLGPIGSPKYLEYAGNIHDSGRHLLAIIDDLLCINEIEAQELALELQPVDVAEVIGASQKMLSQLAKQAGVAINIDIADDFPILMTDERRLRQALINLINNSLKFTPAGGSVTVKGRRDPDDGALLLVVIDTGIGIAEKDIPKVMRMYGQANDAQARKSTGYGLGLPLTRKMIELLGGEFQLSSKVGVGTQVSMRFPPSMAKTD